MANSAILQMQRKIALSRMKINYQRDFMWKMEIDGQPSDLNLFSNQISYGKGSIESKSINIRTGDINMPEKRTAGEVTAVFEDEDTGRISEFITSLQRKIFNPDGTGNLPIEYLFRLKIYRLMNNGEWRLDKKWMVYVEDNNDYTGDNASVTENGTFNVTFKKYKSIGNDDD